MIAGKVTEEGYFVAANVRIDFSSRTAAIDFLVDTGAAVTAIHPKDATLLSVPESVLRNAETESIKGIGGSSIYRLLQGTLLFSDAASPEPIQYAVTLHIAEPTDDNAEIPSLLGRDILNHWRTWQIDPDSDAIGFVPSGP